MVKIQTSNRMFQLLQVLVDSGSQSSFINKKIVRKYEQIPLDWEIENQKCLKVVKPRFSNNYSLTVHLFVLLKLTQTLSKVFSPNMDINK